MVTKHWRRLCLGFVALLAALLPSAATAPRAVAGSHAALAAAAQAARLTAWRQSLLKSAAAGGTAIVGYDTFPVDFNYFTEPDLPSWQTLMLTCAFLVDIAPRSLQPIPDIARSWTISNDGKVYTFYLRPNARFSDGNPVTADDIVWTMQTVANPKIAPSISTFYTAMTSVTAVDRLTVRVTLKESFAPFLANASQMFILEKKVFEHLKNDKPNWGTNYKRWPVGPGPWMIKDVVPNDHITFVPNPYYYGTHPKLSTLIWKTVPDDNTLFEQLQTGEIQATPLLPKFLKVVDRSRFAVYEAGGLGWIAGWINVKRPYFADRRVRQALMYAMDRAGIVKAVYGGHADIMNAEVPPAVGGLYDPNVPNKYPYDPARAKSLLAAAGWKPGAGGTLVSGKTRFAFTLLYTRGDLQAEQVGTIIQQDLANVGISVQLQGLENSVLFASHLNKGNFDAVLQYWYNYAFPDNLFQFGCRQTVAESGTNYGFYCNPAVDKLLEAARTTVNPVAQRMVFDQLQVAMNQDLPYLWLVAARALWVMDKSVHGYQPSPIDTDVWSARWWSE